MTRIFDIRKYGFLIILSLVLFYVSSFFVPETSSGGGNSFFLLKDFFTIEIHHGFLTYFLGFVCLAVISLLVFLYYRFYTTSETFYVATVYALLACTLPVKFSFDPILISVPLFVMVMILQSTLQLKDKNEDSAFLLMFLLALSSFFFTPIAWTFVLLFPLTVSRFDSKWKAMVNALLGFLFPFVLLFGGIAIFAGHEKIPVTIQSLWAELTAIDPKYLPARTASLVKNLLFVILALTTIIRILPSMRVINVVKAAFQTDLMLYLGSLTILAILFCGNLPLVWLFPLIPFSALLFIFFTEKAESRSGGYACLFLFLILI
ncbi:MAG: hypothetical protein IJS02_05370, partial [Bacteroidales bacterium]|nr:hypothetical protein [Bacteroidales bacterium]